MDRRTFLTQFAEGGSLAGFCGCLSSVSGGRSGTTPSPTDDSTQCQSFWSDTDRTICTRQAESGDVPLSLASETGTFTVVLNDQVVETFSLTLHNHASQLFVIDPRRWRLLRQVGGRWTESATGDGSTESVTIRRGRSHTWSLSLTPHPTPRTQEQTFITADLSEGPYLFAVVGTVGPDAQALQIECHTQFVLVKAQGQPTPVTANE